MANCSTCGNAIFDARHGEYKCELKKTYIYNSDSLNCTDHKEGTPKESKANEVYEAILYDNQKEES